MTPRRPRSPWSPSNIERVGRLEAEGRMTEAGRAVVRAAWPKLAAIALGIALWQVVVWSGWKPTFCA